MSKKIVLLTLFSVFLLSAMVVTSSAQPRTVGVTVGKWFKYGTIDINWSSNDPNATFPPSGWEWLEDTNKTEWMLFSIVDVSGTNITFQSTSHFKNGTERIEVYFVDIDTGKDNMTYGVISANLNANDTLYTAYPYSSFTINETIPRTYPDSIRDTNLWNMTWEYSWTQNETQYYYYFTENFYWDKSTGIIVENYFAEINQTGEYITTWSALTSITESNVWAIPEFPTWTSILLMFIVLTVAITIYKRRLLKTLIH